jgi:hypothetical protein
VDLHKESQKEKMEERKYIETDKMEIRKVKCTFQE